MSGLQVNMTKGSILKSLLIFSLPILMSNLFQQLYNTMDILIVGNYLGDSSLATIGVSSQRCCLPCLQRIWWHYLVLNRQRS